MIETFRGIWGFAGEEQRNIRRSVIACFFNAVFHMFEIAAIYYTCLLYTSPQYDELDPDAADFFVPERISVVQIVGNSNVGVAEIQAVSYTHLDVYKRQFLCWPGVMPYSRLNAALNWLIPSYPTACAIC